MSRKQRIVISITGIVLVMLILVGLTYAYFLTRINGNTNDKSISVSTANLELKYADIEQVLISEENVEPGKTWTKKFSATNTGSKKIESYGVALENVINTLERTEDLVYTLNCTSSLGTTCNKVETEQEFPTMGKILITNSIEPEEVQSYELIVSYKDQNVNQSVDMNKQFSAKVNIVNPSTFGVLGSGTLATSLITSGADVKISDTETKNTKTIKNIVNVDNIADGSSWSDEANDFTNDGIFRTIDDYGSSYYFRGPITNNYVNFAGMCWRIIRIQGDGSIKLILEDQDSTCSTSDGNWNIPTETGGTTLKGNFGYTEYATGKITASDGTTNSSSRWVIKYLNSETNNTISMAYAFLEFQKGPLVNFISKLKSGDWCLDQKAYESENDNSTELTNDEITYKYAKGVKFYYDSYIRLNGKTTKEPTLKCNGTVMTKFNDNENMYVGAISADEVVYAGGKIGEENSNYYLINDYQKNNSIYYWTITPYYFNGYYDRALFVRHVGLIGEYSVSNSAYFSFRPSINLKSNIKITGNGNGTKSNPYVVES